MQAPALHHTPVNTPEFLSGGGELGLRIREHDWSKTPLGPVYTWPQSLRTCIRIMLTSRQPIWIGWGKDLIKFYNDPYKAIVGGKHPWALGTPASVVWKDIWADIEPMLQTVMEKDEGTYVESQLLIMERNGYPEETYYTFSYTPIPGDDGKTAGMFCANTDDTDRIISERQLKTLTQLGKQLTDSRTNEEVIERTISTLQENPWDFPFALFRKIVNNKAVLVNSTTLGESAHLIPKELDLDSDYVFADVIKTALATRRLQLVENLTQVLGTLPSGAWPIAPDKAIVLPIVQSASKEPFGVMIIGLNPYRLLDEKYTSFFSLVGDQVATSFANVHVLEEERKRSEALAEIDRAKTTFFSNISHEFRTPLTLLLGPIEEALADPDTNQNNKHRLDLAYRNTLRMQKLVNTLLEFSRIEAGRLDARFSKVDIVTFTEDLVSTFRSAVEKAGMQLVFSHGNIHNNVYVDADMWEKIVLNLVSNAFKYTTHGKIEIRLEEQNNTIQLKVSDTGVGIPDDQLDKIFDRFHRVENIQGRSGEGTGIGLSMVKELVKLHQGSIKVESKVGEGSNFIVTIPAGSDHIPAQSLSEAAVKFNSTASANVFVQEALKWIPEQTESVNIEQSDKNGKPVVLLADDNADMRDYVHRLLSDDFHLITASDGEEAFNKFVQHSPALVISDMMMPRVNGFELLNKIRSHSSMRNTPVIFLSARAGEEAKVEGLEAGADDYLVKPFSAKELLVRVHNRIRMNQVRDETLQQLYKLFEEAPAHIHLFRGPDHVFEFFHPRAKALLGRDVTGMKLKDALPEYKDYPFFNVLDQVYNTGKTIEAKEMLVAMPGEKGEMVDYYFNLIYQPWYDIKGKIDGVLNFAVDVTETVRSRKQVEESESYFRKLADSVPAILWITEKDGYCSYLSRSWYDTTGQKPEEALGFGWINATHPDDAKEAERAFLESNANLTNFNTVYRLRQKNGEYRWAIDRGSPWFDNEGNFAGFIGTVIDVHEAKVAEDKIRKSEAEFRQLANAMPQLVWVANAGGDVVYYNDRVAEFAGATQTSEGLWLWDGLVHPDDLDETYRAWKHAVETGSLYQAEHRVQMRDGTYRWFLSRAIPFKDEHAAVVKWFGTATDIHVSKEQATILEEEVKKRTSELSELNGILQRSNHELQQFAHVASHDLKEPLRKIKIFAGRLSQDASVFSDKAKVFIDKINSASDRMLTMVEGVLNYSVINGNQQQIEPVNLNSVMESIQNDLELPIAQKQAVIRYSDLPTIEGSMVLLYQLFYNLLNNSLKFARPGVPAVIDITSTVFDKDGHKFVKLIIRDNGVGFEQVYAEKIFESFTRLNSKDQFEGTGLGLSLCKRIAERHGGSIVAVSELGEGAEFVVVLPVEQEVMGL